MTHYAADIILAVHWLFVLFNVTGQMAILFGAAFGWHWVRNRLFRWLHLASIGTVVLLSCLDAACPLTLLENHLRMRTGGRLYETSFIGYWMNRLLYFDAPQWVFITAYTLFGCVVLVSWITIPPVKKNDDSSAHETDGSGS